MQALMEERRFDFVPRQDKAFIMAFDEEMGKLGYDCGGEIGSGFCWGPYMIIYAKTGVKGKKVAARIYIREDGIILRLFFSKIDDHRAYIEAAPDHIRDVFSGSHGDCHRCPAKPGGVCAFRKTYTVDGRLMEKCSGTVFEFHDPTLEKLPDYVDLLHEFYAAKRRSR